MTMKKSRKGRRPSCLINYTPHWEQFDLVWGINDDKVRWDFSNLTPSGGWPHRWPEVKKLRREVLDE